jgi:hypothetical protein
MRLITGKISKKRGNINMKTSKKKEILSFTHKNHWYRVLLPRTARSVVDQTLHVSCYFLSRTKNQRW